MNINELIKQLGYVLNALNSVSVCGKPNLANLSGSISLLEQIQGNLQKIAASEAYAGENNTDML